MEFEHITRIAWLLSHRFSDTLTAAENEELEAWLAADKQNSLLAEQIFRRNFFSDKQIQEHLYNSLTAFEKVQSRRSRHLLQMRMWKIYGSIAAVAILLIGLSLFKLYDPTADGISRLPQTQLAAGESRAVLTMANGQRIQLTRHMGDSVVIAGGIRMDATGEAVEYKQEVENMVTAFNTLEVPRKGEFRLVLSDGTKVWMNSESRIKYPIAFVGKERRVYLEGEAYFEVSKNQEMPFIVDMGKASIQVLGTSFNARAYQDEPQICATLAEGQIQLKAGTKNVILAPEEQGIFELITGNLSRKKVDINLYMGWKDGRFIFQEQTLEEMMNTLSRWYDIQVFFENSKVREITFSGNLKRYDSFNEIIRLLEMTGMAHFKVNGNSILISE